MTAYINWAFPATGAPASRKQADRESDIVNVKDWGATGDGSTDDTVAIQNAVNACIANVHTGGGGGIVFFPNGQYKLTSPITVGHDTRSDIGVQLIGTGEFATGFNVDALAGLWTFSKGSKAICCIEKVEGLGTLALKLERPGVSVINCSEVRVNAAGADGAFIQGCQASGSNSNSNTTTPGPTYLGDCAFYIGTGVLSNCRATGGFDPTYALSGIGSVCIGCSSETVSCGIRVGWGPPSSGMGIGHEVASYGASVLGFQTERNNNAVDLYNATACYVAANVLTATTGVAGEAPVYTLSWSANKVTVTTGSGSAQAHNIGSAQSVFLFGATTPGYPFNVPLQMRFSAANAAWVGTDPAMASTGDVIATVINSTQFTYARVGNPGSYTNDGQQVWLYPPQYAIRCRKVYESIIEANDIAQVVAAQGSIDLDYGGQSEFRNNIMRSTSANYSYKMPTNPGQLAGWKFENCGGSLGLFGQGVASPDGYLTFTGLPGQSGVMQDGPFEGQEYSITDGQKSGGGSAVWNDIVAGGSSGKYLVRYDGSVWRRIG